MMLSGVTTCRKYEASEAGEVGSPANRELLRAVMMTGVERLLALEEIAAAHTLVQAGGRIALVRA